MDVQDIVNTIANQVNIDPLTTEKVVGTILSVLQHEAEGTSAATLFDKLPGSTELAQKYDVMAAKDRIFTDGRTPVDDPDPTYNGYSIGHWEGDTLVVRTTAVKPDLGLFRFGATHSDKLVINERIHLKPGDPNILQIDYTFEDPEALAQPWHQSAAFERHRDLDQIEFVCAENDRNPVSAGGDTEFIEAGKN